MRCLVISPQPFFTPRGTPFSVYFRTLVLSELGADMDMVTYGEGADPDIPNLRIFRIPRFARLGQVKPGPSKLKLFFDLFVFLRTVGLLLRHRYEIVVAHEEAVFFCRFLKPIFRFKLVYDMHSSLPQQLENFNFTRSKIIHYIFNWLEATSLNSSDAIITISPDLMEHVRQVSKNPGKLYLIENSILDRVKLHDDKPTAEDAWSSEKVEELIADRHCFVYAGTLEPYQGIDMLLRAFSIVIQRRPDAFLMIVGGTAAQVEKYRKMALDEGLERHCHFPGTVSHRAVQKFLLSADALLSPRTIGMNTPLKIYELLASGVPVIATNIRSHTQVLNEEVAFLADPEPTAFAEAMIATMSDDEAARTKAENALHLYEKSYSRESYVRKLTALLNDLS